MNDVYNHNDISDWLKYYHQDKKMKLKWKKSIYMYNLRDGTEVHKEIFYSGNILNKILQYFNIVPYYERYETIKFKDDNTKFERV